MENKTNVKIKNFRKLMKKENIDFYLITLKDFHNSEYPANYFKGIEYITNFTGSNATLVITKEASYIWTDGRYFKQCEKEISGSELKMMKQGQEGYPTVEEFFEKNLEENMILGFDGGTVDYNTFKKYERISLKKKFKMKTNIDLLDKIWKERPDFPKEKAIILKEEYTGKETLEKINEIRKIIREKGATSHIVSTLDDIAWIFNMRGRDIKYNPFFMSYAYISLNEIILFVNKEIILKDTREYLEAQGIILKDYSSFYNYISKIKEEEVVLIDNNNINSLMYNSLPEKLKKINTINLSTMLKAIKNPKEVENTKKAHIEESLAITKLMYWIKTKWKEEKITELDVVRKIKELREEKSYTKASYYDENFGTIAAYGKNAAMMHYHSEEETNALLEEGNFLLVDTGAHYLEGSTDTTRTFAIGSIGGELKKHYTYVLKSLISLSKLKFLKGATCGNLDTIARSVIWSLDLDYRCATGHGVGHLLGVHEGPNVIRGTSQVVMETSMITTIEPGIYIEDSHGIRLENEVITKEILKNEYGQFLNFETITFVPFDLEAIDATYLTQEELNWLNSYHKLVYEKLHIYLNSEEKQWLKEKTIEIKVKI